jgi:hypothetical protein
MSASSPCNVYILKCPYRERDAAKRRGAKWSAELHAWVVCDHILDENPALFARWHPSKSAVDGPSDAITCGRVAHCFDCHASLSDLEYPLCDECGWIVCTCGACGCVYEGMDDD